MLLTNWLTKLTSRISKRRVFRSRDRRDIRKRWQSIIHNQISTTEALEDRTLLTVLAVLTPPSDVGPAQSGDASYSFIVTYSTDDAALIDVDSIDTSDVTVTGPGGGVSVINAVATGGIDADPLTVTYTITPPGGTWDVSDTGLYNIAVNGGQVADDLGVTISGMSLGSFNVDVNNAPTVGGPVISMATEDDGIYVLDLLTGASDLDPGDMLNISGLTLDSGNASGITVVGNTLSINPNAYNSLAFGESSVIQYSYDVVDGNGGSVSQTATITINGVNDPPTVGPAVSSTVTEDDVAYILNLLTGASDPDTTDTLNISGLTLDSGDASGITVVGNTLSIDPNAYNSLYTGDTEIISYSYNVVDGNGGSVAQAATITINGVNDAPTVTAFLAPNVGAAEILETSYTFTVTYSDDAEIDIATLSPADVTITGPGGTLTVVSAVPDVGTNGTPRTVTYTVTPPGGSWNDADNGLYTIAINGSEVGDDGVPKLFVAGDSSVATFTVTLPPTDLIATIAAGNLTINQNTNTDSTLSITESGGVITVHDSSNTIIAPAGGAQLDPNTFTIPVAALTGGTIFVTGGTGSDTLTIDTSLAAAGIRVSYSGGGGAGSDTLELTGSAGSVEHRFLNENDGSVRLDGSVSDFITYDGLEPIYDFSVAADKEFNYLGGAETITLKDDVDNGGGAAAGWSQIDSDLEGEISFFVNPTANLTITTTNGSGVDSVHIEGLDADFNANLAVNTGTDDSVTFQTNTTDVDTGNLDINAGSINLNAAITTSGDVALDATNGSISGTSLVTAINADLRATGNVGASGTEVELAVDALEADVDGSLYVDNTGTLSIGYVGGTLTGVSVGAASTITSTGSMTVTENVAASGGNLLLRNTGGDFDLNALAIISNNSTFEIGIDSAGAVTLADTSAVTSSGTGLVNIDAVNNIALANVNTSGEVQVTTSAGSITDNTAAEAALISANTVALRAATGIGAAGDADIDLAINTLAANTTAGDIFLQEPSAAIIGTVDLLSGITAAGNINLNIGGILSINQIIEATVAASTIVVNGASDINVNQTVQTNGGTIDLIADNDLNLNLISDIDTTSAAAVTLTADADAIGGGAFVQIEGSVVNAQGGALNLNSSGNLFIADLQSAGGTITIDSISGAIIDNTGGETPLIIGGQLAISALNGIGTSTGDEDIETAVGTLSAFTTNNDVVISNTGALIIGNVAPLSGVTSMNGSVSLVNSGALTVDQSISGSSVTLEVVDTAAAGENLTLNAGITSTGAGVTLRVGDDLNLSTGVTVDAAAALQIAIDYLNADVGTGGVANLFGTLIAGTNITLTGFNDADTVNIDDNGGTASDGGTVDGIQDAFTFNGGGGLDQFVLDETGDMSGDTISISHTGGGTGVVSGAGLAGLGFNFAGGPAAITLNTGTDADDISIELGDGSPHVNITSAGGVDSLTVLGRAGIDDLLAATPGALGTGSGTILDLGFPKTIDFDGITGPILINGRGSAVTDLVTVFGTAAVDTTTIGPSGPVLLAEIDPTLVTVGVQNIDVLLVDTGDGADSIIVDPDPVIEISIVGGNPAAPDSPADSLQYNTPPGEGSTFTPDGLDGGTIESTGSFADVIFDQIEGLAFVGSLTVTGTAGDDTLTITATSSNSGTYQIGAGPVINFSGVTDFIFNGGDGDDVLIIDNSLIVPTAGSDLFNPVNGITFNGQGNTAVGDSLQILGGDATTVEHQFLNNNDGYVFYDGESTATITYTGLEPVLDTTVANDRTFSFLGGAETITLSDDVDFLPSPVAGQSQIDSDLFGEYVAFLNPTDNLIINTEASGGSGADSVHIEGLDADFNANLTVNAGTDDSVTFQTNTTDVDTGNLDINAGSIALNAAVTTTGDVALDATNGSISGTSLVTATNADLRATGNVGASGTEVELAVDALEADVDGSLYVDNTGTLSIGYVGGTLTGVSVGAASTITSTGTLLVTENITATGSGTIRVESSGGNVQMTSGTQIDGDSGNLEVVAANDVELGLLTTSANVSVTATAGAITDINGGSNNINAVNATLNAGTGAGVGDALETTITALEANTGAGLEVDDAGTLNIGFAGGIVGVTVGAPSRIESTGTLTVTEDITASGGNLQLENTGGNFVLNASTTISNGGFSIQVDSANDLTVNGTVQTTDGAISLRADSELDLGATSIVQTTSGTSTATVTLAADFDDNNSGAFSQDEGSVVDAQDGALNVTAYGNIEIADLRGATVQVDSEGGAILDNTVAETALITATNAYLEAGTSVGTGEDIDTAVSTLAGRSQNGQFRVSNSGALTIGTVTGFPAGVIATSGGVTITAASPMIIANNVSGAGTVTLTSTDAAGAGDDLTINAGVTVESTAADVALNSGDDFLLTLGGTVRAATTIEINVDPITDGTGATVDLLGNVDATLTTINGGDDADIFNILPTQDSPITVNGGDPVFPGPGDVLNMDFSGVTNPSLTLGAAPGSGTFGFFAPDTEQTVDYTGIENVNTSTGAYHLILNMVTSGFQDTVADEINATVDGTGTNLLLDINGGNFFTGAVADILSFTTVGSTDDETLNINENATGGLPFFQVAAPAVTGSAGSHLNASANTYLDATYPPAYTVDDITIHYDGGAGTDSVNVNFTTDHNAAYFTDIIDAAGSGNITSSTIADTDIDLGLSFARLEGVGFTGTAAGELRVDASSNSFTNNIAINDDGNAADGISQIVGNMQFTDVLFEGFSDLQVLSGTGAELLDLIGLDSATTLTNVVLNAGDISGTDTGNDTIRVRSTPAGTVTNVSVSGGLGDDLIQIFDGGNTVDNIFAAIQVFGQGGTDTLTLTDSGDGTGDTFEVTSTTIEGITGNATVNPDVTFTDIDALNVTGTGGNDTINVNLGAQLDLNTVTINGSGGDDTFNLNNSTPVGVDTRLNGEAGLDEFIFLASNVLRGFINGGADVDTIDYSGYTPVVHVALSGIGSVDGFQGRENNGSILGTGVASLAFDNIDDLVGTAGVDTLEGPDLRNYWGITSTDEGFIIADRVALAIGRPTTAGDATATPPEERLDFTSFQNLIGGSQDDRFDLSDGAGLTGTLNGDSGNDSLDYRDFTTAVTVDLFAGTATNIGGGLVAGTGGGDDDNSIENVFGGNGNDNITGDNDNNILGDGLGSDFLDGGGDGVGSGNGGNDVFLMEPGAGGSADVITDIHGNDTVDFRFASAGIVFDVDIINTPQDVFGGNTVELRQIQPEQPDTNPSFMENVVGSQFDDYIYIDPLSQDGNFPIDGPPVLRSADGQGGTDFLDFDAKGQEVIDTGFSLTADGVGTVQYLNFENITPFEDNPAFIVDNGDPGFTITGDWPYHPPGIAITNGIGFEDDIHSVAGLDPYGTGPAQAFWEFFGLTPGEYRVSVTWPESSNPFAATDAPFTIYDGARTEIGGSAVDLGTYDVNQQLTPDDYSAAGTTWEILDTFTVNSRTLTVMLTNLADGLITADAIRIERVSAGPEIELVDVTDALAPPALIVDGHPDGIQFGPTELLTDAVRTFEITNNGSAVLNISNISLPAGYTTDLTPQAVGIGSTISFTITMGSDSFGDRSGIFSFDTDDVDESTFNILLDGQVSNVVIIDDGDVEFTATAGFESFNTRVNEGSYGYEGDVSGAVPNDPGNTPAPATETATWTFTGLAAGNYRVSTTWSELFNRVTDAPFSLDGGAGTLDIDVDQSVAPSSFIEDGTAWFDLSSSFSVSAAGQLVVTLTNEASNFIRDHYDLANGVIADAIRIEYLPEPDLEITVDGGTVVDDDTGVVDFGSTIPGIPVIKEFTITNLSTTEAVNVTGLIEFPPGFSIDPTSPFGTDAVSVPIAAGGSVVFRIQFDGGTNGTTFGQISFTTGDADENPFNFTVRGESGPATVEITDPEFSTTGTWESYTPGNVGDPQFLTAGEEFVTGTGANAATWEFDVEPGRYQVVAHWYVNPDVTMNGHGAAPNAPYTIFGGAVPVTVLVNQQISSNDFLDDGIYWEYIGNPVEITGNSLSVQLTDLADGLVYADEIRIYRVVDPVIDVQVDGDTLADGDTVNFDDTIVGAPVVKTFTVTNYGERNMALAPINFPPGFSLVSGFGSTNLAPGASTTFTLQMDAGSAGSFSGVVSFGVDSSDANPFNFTVSGSASETMIIDNGDIGYSTTGDWVSRYATSIYDYYENDQDELPSDNLPGTSTATWDFTNLAAGTYSISSHWAAHSGMASNAQFLISGIQGGDITVSLDQRFAANDFVDGGVNWETLGTFQVAAGGNFTITLLDDGGLGHLAADAMRLEVLSAGSIAPEIEVQAGAVSLTDGVSSLDLGTAFFGESLFQTFTITNTGTDTLNLGAVVPPAAPGFSISVPLGTTTLFAGQSTTFEVEFNNTTVAGLSSGTLTIPNDDADEAPFTIDLSATMDPSLIVDDGDAGFSSTGGFYATSWLTYFQLDTRQLNTGDSGTATWDFSSLPAGSYTVYATWSAHGSLATNAEYSINAGGPIVGPIVVNQRVAPNDLTSDGANWEILGVVNVLAGGSISVVLEDNAADGRIRADAIRIERTGPLMAAAGVSPSNAPAITQSDLDSVRDAALNYWKATGLSETQISLLESVSFVLADLPDAMLGGATTTTILIDINAAGYGWFVDDTPFDSSEYSLDADGDLVAGIGSAAFGQMDLLTVVLHEMGHTLGYDDLDSDDSLMGDTLDASERRLPGIDDFFSGVAEGDNPLLD